jgi:hypothetical protein
MTLEIQLRDALATRAEDIPRASAERLSAHDYRPRTRDLRPPVAAGALLTAAAAAATVALVDLGPSAPAAFAGWTSKPTAAPKAQVAGAESGCTQQLAAIRTSAAARNVGKVTGRPMGLPSIATLTPVLSDTRGPFTFLVFSDATGDTNASCISGPGFNSVSEARSVTAPPAVPADGITVTWEAHTARAGQAYSFAEGHTGADVTAVALQLADGTTVQTSTQNGWFVAWWPGSTGATSSTVTTASGTTTAPLPAANVPACPPAPSGGAVSCTAGAQGAAGGSAAGGSAAGGGAAAGMMSQSSSGR